MNTTIQRMRSKIDSRCSCWLSLLMLISLQGL
jgi:hypothetical protein